MNSLIKRLMLIIPGLLIYLTSLGGIDVVFVTLSGDSVSYERTLKKVKTLVETSDNEFILFFSNGPKPTIVTKLEDLESALWDVNGITGFSNPGPYDDIQKLNSLFSEHAYFSNINEENRNLEQDVNFHFFLDVTETNLYNHLEKLLKHLLLTNRLMNRNGLVESCKVHVYFDEKNCENTDKNIKNYENEFAFFSYYTY